MRPHQRWRNAVILSAVLLIVSVSTGLVGCTKSWRSKGIEAQVVDSVTGEPVPDAIVLVNWQIKGMMEGYPMGQLAIFERATDAQGRFHTPAWGPRRPPYNTGVSPRSPTIRVFKKGYEPLMVYGLNELSADFRSDAKSIQIRLVKDPEMGTGGAMAAFTASLRSTFLSGRCDWRLAPLLFQTLVQLRAELDDQDLASHLPMQSELCDNNNDQD